jgi:hypothetical protein
MYQPDITTYLDAIKQQYETLLEENRNLKQENTRLADANGQYIRKIQYYMSVFNKQNTNKELGLKSLLKNTRCLKRGSDWLIEGDMLLDVSLSGKLTMPCKITNATVSRCGEYIAFGCNQQGFLVHRGTTYLLSTSTERMEVYDRSVFEAGFQEPKAYHMGFTEDSAHLYATNGRGMMLMWSLEERALELSFKVGEAVGICVSGKLVLVAGSDKTLKVYENTKHILTMPSSEELNGPMTAISGSDIVYAVVGKNKLGVFDLKAESHYSSVVSEERILGIAISKEHRVLSVGGYSRQTGLHRIKVDKPTFRLVDTIEQKGAVMSLAFLDGLLVAGQQEGFIVWDITQKRSMRVQMNESNTIGLSVGGGFLVSVDNNGILRSWKVSISG